MTGLRFIVEGFRVYGLGFRVLGSGLRVEGLACRVYCLGAEGVRACSFFRGRWAVPILLMHLVLQYS